MTDLELFNMDNLLRKIGGSRPTLKTLLNLFVNSKDIEKFKEAINAKDYSTASSVAHAIKGMTGNIDLTAVFQSSAKLNKDLNEGIVDQAQIDDFLALYEETLSYVKGLIQTL